LPTFQILTSFISAKHNLMHSTSPAPVLQMLEGFEVWNIKAYYVVLQQ